MSVIVSSWRLWLWRTSGAGVLLDQENATAKKVEVGSAKHLPLQHFHAINIAFDSAATPLQRETVADSIVVFEQTIGETRELFDATGSGGGDPCVQVFARVRGPFPRSRRRAGLPAQPRCPRRNPGRRSHPDHPLPDEVL